MSSSPRGDLDLDTLVTRRYRLEQVNEAISALAKGEIEGRALFEFWRGLVEDEDERVQGTIIE